MKKAVAFLSIPLLIAAVTGCSSNGSNLPPPGHYTETSTSVDPAGTTREVETESEVYYDAQGNKKAIVNKTVTTDPKGLFNKSTTEVNTLEE